MDEGSALLIKILAAGGSAIGLIGVLYGYFQKRQFKKERAEKTSALMESAHELARAQNAAKPIDQLIDESNKRYGPGVADKPKSK